VGGGCEEVWGAEVVLLICEVGLCFTVVPLQKLDLILRLWVWPRYTPAALSIRSINTL